MRTMNIYLPREQLLQQKGIERALLRFATWGGEEYDTVDVSPDFVKAGNIIATFTNSRNPTGFVMGAIYDEEKQAFSYHS